MSKTILKSAFQFKTLLKGAQKLSENVISTSMILICAVKSEWTSEKTATFSNPVVDLRCLNLKSCRP